MDYLLLPYGRAFCAILTRDPRPESPAARLALARNDRIIALDGIPFRAPIDLKFHYSDTLVDYVKAGDLTGRIQRGSVDLGPRHLHDFLAPNYGLCYVLVPHGAALGARVSRYPIAGSPCAGIGLEPGDMIITIDGAPICGHRDVAAHVGRTALEILDVRTGQRRRASITLPRQTAASRVAS
jgi:C-terminal processing protease CtpA/Prc